MKLIILEYSMIKIIQNSYFRIVKRITMTDNGDKQEMWINLLNQEK